MMPTSGHIRRDIVQVCRHLYQRGFVVGTEGNVSVRVAPNRFWITPTGCHKGLLEPGDLLLIDLDGQVHFGLGQPSSEMPMHLALYMHRPDIVAVVHAHPPLATALTVAGYTLDSMLLPESVVALGEVPTIPYQMPTTLQFAHAVGEAMCDAEAVLLEQHGSVTVGASLQAAFNRMEIVERVAQIFYLAKTLGDVRRLPSVEIEALKALRGS
ncbi:MAG: class II aldolase/adducin family protein [bacterium]|nr:class II aldolase/adducin family protein [bacterium]